MALELLAIGDMHLGRRPSRLPGELAESGRSYGPAEAWTRAVRHAVETGVDVVALAGDLVDQEDDFFEAYSVIYRTLTSYGSSGPRSAQTALLHPPGLCTGDFRFACPCRGRPAIRRLRSPSHGLAISSAAQFRGPQF